MERNQVVVHRPANGNEPVRVGTVLSRADGRMNRYLVRWADGTEEAVTLSSRVVLAARNSLRHLHLVDPAALADQFQADPKAVVLRLLRESPSALTATGVRNQLEAYGLRDKDVADAWSAAQRGFATNPNVQATGKGSGRQYKWIGEVAGQPPVPAGEQPPRHVDRHKTQVSRDEAQASGGGGRAGAPPGGLEAPDELEVAPPGELEAPDELEAAPPGDGTPAATAAATEAPTDRASDAKPKSASALLAEALGDEPGSVDGLFRRPLWTGVRIGQLSKPAVAALSASLRDQLSAVLLLAVPGHDDAIDKPEKPATEQVGALLAGAAAEIRAGREPDPRCRTAAGWLLRRVCAHIDAPALPPVIELADFVARGEKPDAAALEAAAYAMARLLPQVPREKLASVDLDGVSAGVRGLPWEAKGPRTAVVTAVARAVPERIADRMWWAGASLRDLVDCAAGPLGSVTSHPAVAEQVIAPLVRRELAAVTSRAGLAFLLGLPREFAAQLPGEGVADALRRVAAEEPVVRDWVQALSGHGRIKALEGELENLRAGSVAALEGARAAEARQRDLAERHQRLEETLRVQHAQAVKMRASHERQVRIDAVRALAFLAAEVEELAVNGSGAPVLVERVRGLVTAQDLEPVGVVGERTIFDPQTHEAIVGLPEAGSAVDVVRPGYWWRAAGESILLAKALVTAI